MAIPNKVVLNIVFQTQEWIDKTGITYNKANIIKKFLDDINFRAHFSYYIHTSIEGNCFSIEVDKYNCDDFTIHKIPVFSAKWYLG